MAKYTQAIRRQFAVELFECVRPFCGVGASGVKIMKISFAFKFSKVNILGFLVRCGQYKELGIYL